MEGVNSREKLSLSDLMFCGRMEGVVFRIEDTLSCSGGSFGGVSSAGKILFVGGGESCKEEEME